MTTSTISDQTSPDSITIKIGGWLFRRRTALPFPFALALLLIQTGQAPFSWTLAGSGVVLTLAGEAIRLAAVHHIGAISRTRSERVGPLISSGPFGIVRNPLYVGNILLWVGFALTAHLVWAAPVVFVLLLGEYHAIVRWEEHLLESRYGDAYRAYVTRVPRWIPGPGGGGNSANANTDARDATAPFSMAETLFSERGTLIAIGVGYVLLWIKLAVFSS